MKRLFAVIRTRGGAWQDLCPLEGQQDWDAHAAFMNALLKIVRADTPDEIVGRLSTDPWTGLDLLWTSLIAPWTVRLGSLAP